MRVLVTGGAGYIGSHTAWKLHAQGHDPVVLDDLSMGHREFARFGPFEFGSVLDESRVVGVLREHRIEAVVHFAAKAMVGESARVPERYMQTNVGGMATLLSAMKAVGVTRIVFSSSAAVYGEGSAGLLREDSPTVPVNAYGLSKLQAEQVLAAVAPTFGLRWAALRYFNVIGADAEHGLREWHDPETHLVPTLLLAARESRPAKLFGSDYPTPDGTAVRDYMDVRDLAQVHVDALAHLERSPAFISNVGRGAGLSVKTVVEAARKVWQVPLPIEMQARRVGDPAALVADATFFKTWSATAQRGLLPLEESLGSLASMLKST